MNQEITNFKATEDAAFGQINTALTAIQTGQSALLTQVQNLQAQLASNPGLGADDKAALDAVVAETQNVVTQTANLQAALPAPPAPPATGTGTSS